MRTEAAAPATVVRRASSLGVEEVAELAEILVACVDEGASLGFHAPLDAGRARAW